METTEQLLAEQRALLVQSLRGKASKSTRCRLDYIRAELAHRAASREEN